MFKPLFQPVAHHLSSRIGYGESSINGVVTADDYSVTEGDTVTLTLDDTSVDVLNNAYQWIDENGDNIIGETTVETEWESVIDEDPPRIRVTNSTTDSVRIFTVVQPITIAEAP